MQRGDAGSAKPRATRDADGGGIIYHSCSRPMGTEPGVLSFLNIFLGYHLSFLEVAVNPHERWNYALQSRSNSTRP
jgi:hypothetical protein